MRLRHYQTKATRRIDAAWKAGHRAVLLVMPPNAGKTVVFLHVIRKALKRGERVCVVAPNVVLTQQTIDKFSHIDHGIIWADKTTGEDKQLQIASAPTLANRLDEYEFDLIVVDEAHHCAANTWKKILDRYNTARVLGVTATAKRLDGKGLDACGFTGLVRGPWIDALTPQHMTPYRMWAPNVPELLDAPEGSDYKAADLAKHGIEMGVLIGDAVKHYAKHCAGKRALAFCMSIEDSKATVKRFIRAGYKAAHMDGNTPHEERQRLLADLNARRLDLISSCNVLGEGLDIPGVDVVIQLRPTRSYQMWLQQLGRGFRLDAENPDKLLDVIDCAGNYFRFWSPSVDRGYGLDGAPALDVERQQTQRRCAECGLVYMADGRGYCPECHAETAAAAAADTERRAVWRDGELVQVVKSNGWRLAGAPLVLLEERGQKSSKYKVCLRHNGIDYDTYLGSDRKSAQSKVDIANGYFAQFGTWPNTVEEFRKLIGIKPKQKRKDRVTGLLAIHSKTNKSGMVSFWTRYWFDRNPKFFYFKTEAEAKKCIAKAKRMIDAGLVPKSEVELRDWMGIGQKLGRTCRLRWNGCWCVNKAIAGKKMYFNLGKNKEIAEAAIRSANDRFNVEGEWPSSVDEFYSWFGIQPANDGRIVLRKSNDGYFRAGKNINKKLVNVSLTKNKEYAQAAIDRANALFDAEGKWPDTKDEFRAWLGVGPANENKPLVLSSSQGKKNPYYLVTKYFGGKCKKFCLRSDHEYAQSCVDAANAKWEANGREWPETAEEFREWLGIDTPIKINGTTALTLRSRNERSGLLIHEASKTVGGKSHTVRLGTDPAIAQARVDQANARWEANGYKWPDTAEEFREWLTLPPPS